MKRWISVKYKPQNIEETFSLLRVYNCEFFPDQVEDYLCQAYILPLAHNLNESSYVDISGSKTWL